MKTENLIEPFSVNNKDVKVGDKDILKVTNVWNRKSFVCLQFNEESKIVVVASELIRAINNSTNVED